MQNQGIYIQPDKIENNQVVKSCDIIYGDKQESLYFKFPIKYKDELSSLADSWVILCLHKMMRAGGDFPVNGDISASLLDNLEKYCDCWRTLRPDYKPINIIPNAEFDDTIKTLENRAIMTFSGGLDASFSLFRHKTGRAGRNTKNIERAVLLFGMADTPLAKPEEFKLHAENARALCENMGVEFLTVETNFCLYWSDWSVEHFNVVVAALGFFTKHPYKITASSLCVLPVSYKIWSSNPITDLMLSSNWAQVISDDVAYDRTMKANVVKDWGLATEKMRVCWEGKDKSKNCGKCEKCIRTMLNFVACGVTHELKMFPEGAYKNMRKNAKEIRHYPKWQYVRLLDALGQMPEQNKEYIKIVKNVLKINQNKRHRHSFWWHLIRMKF